MGHGGPPQKMEKLLFKAEKLLPQKFFEKKKEKLREGFGSFSGDKGIIAKTRLPI